MATKNKTAETKVDVTDFIHAYVDNAQKKADSFKLIELMTKWTGYEPRMWGPTIVGFGSYHYKYASGHEGDSAIVGFSPRKAEFSLYVFSQTEEGRRLLDGLGKFKMGKACIYVKRLSDIDLDVLQLLCEDSIKWVNEHYTNTSGSK
jgi:hypothetical protein